MKNLLFIIVLSLALFAGCATSDKMQGMDYSVFYSGKKFSKPLRGAKVFNSAGEYNSFLMARAIKAPDFLNNFDFENNSLLVAYLGKKAEQGYGIEIKSVADDEKIIVTASETSPDKGMAPQYFLAIKKTDKEAKLIIE